jgi:predicted DNA-binding transcriptional regulator YafY
MTAVSFTYLGGSNPGARRTVCPYGILFDRMNYLVAAEMGTHQPRSWRLDRIRSIELTDTPACPPPGFAMSDYIAQSFGVYQDAPEDVVLRVLPEGADDARAWRFHPGQVLEEEEDGSVLVRFRSGGMRELAWHLFTWEEKVEILAPERLKATMRELLEICSRRHLGERTTDPVVAST